MECKVELLTSDSDAWDDSALIKAWDETITSFKDGIAVSPSEDVSKPLKVIRKKKKSKKCKPSDRNWSIGETCEALYEIDGLFYLAKILEINDNVVKVNFVEYDDICEVDIGDLRKLKVAQSKKPTPSQSSQSDVFNSNPNSSASMSANNFGLNDGFYYNFPIPPPACPVHHYPTHFSQPPNHTSAPKPPCPSHIPQACTDQALASMLMSWYKTGYSTGYYQALKDHHITSNKH